MVTPSTELVIEGFPRSANTFAVVAFESVQHNKVRLAHHLHAQAQVIRAIQLGIPTCVLIREPSEAIRSLIVRHKHISWKAALTHYLAFYGDISGLRDRFVVATFQQVIGDFGEVIRKINSRFGTQFREFVAGEAAVRRVMDKVSEINERMDGGREDAVAWPSEKRNVLKLAVPEPSGSAELEMLRCARELFNSYAEI